ncbi:probable cytochrome P450 6a14 [Homalodisca vitripennis]|uniref:probable cytochrome P450 6a14 n=1 Tax=Homalodisca vitripennis TaxID=197043 RepID=UPI001EEA847B|nr:probable cytochrome P450 6a14 [Homalodisca vitripennis]
MICDPKLVECILVKDYNHFHDRATLWNSDKLLSKSLLDAKGSDWRLLRQNLLPIFSSGKLKGMFTQIFNCGDWITKRIKSVAVTGDSVEMESLVFECVTEVIASCTFGVQVLSDPNENKKFKAVYNHIYSYSPLKLIKHLNSLVHKHIFSIFRVSGIHKSVPGYFISLTKSIIEYRKLNKIKRPDFLQLMLDLKDEQEADCMSNMKKRKETCLFSNSATHVMNDSKEEKLLFNEERIASQMFSFLFAGASYTATTMSFALFEIAKNDLIQRRLQEEIEASLMKQRGWNYLAIKNMIYLDQVIQEVLRLHLFSPYTRLVTEPYTIPGTQITLERGMLVFIPVSAIHRDPQYYPSPEQFNPDRFAGNNYKPSATFLPFGHGPKICIAVKFAMLIVKVCLARILSSYTIRLSEKMELPMCLDLEAPTPRIKGGLWLEFQKKK